MSCPKDKTFPSTSISGKAAPILQGDKGEAEVEKRERNTRHPGEEGTGKEKYGTTCHKSPDPSIC